MQILLSRGTFASTSKTREQPNYRLLAKSKHFARQLHMHSFPEDIVAHVIIPVVVLIVIPDASVQPKIVAVFCNFYGLSILSEK